MLYDPSLDRRSFGDAVAEAAQADRVAAPPRRGRARRIILWSLAALLVAIVAIVGAITLIITRSVDLPFLRNQVGAMIEEALGPGYSTSIGDAFLGVDPVLGLVLRLNDISVRDGAGQEVLRASTTLMAVDLAAIVSAGTPIRSVEVDDLWVTLRRDGARVFLGNPDSPVPPAATSATAEPRTTPGGFTALSDPIEALDRSLAEVLNFASRSGFESIRVYGAEVDLWRTGRAEPQHFARADVVFDADATTGRLNASLSASGYSGRWSVTADRVINPGTGGRMMTIVFSQLTMADFFGAGSLTADIPFYGRGTIRISPEGSVQSATASLNLGAGYFAFGPAAPHILLNEAAVMARWDVANDIIVIDPARFDFGPSHANFTGWIRPDGDPSARRFSFSLESTDAVLDPRDSPAPALAIQQFRLAGTADLGASLLTFDRASIATALGSLVAAGSIGFEPGGPSIVMAATLTEMPMTTLMQLWPAGLQEGGRRWTMDSISAGVIKRGQFEAEIPAAALAGDIPLTPEMLRLELELEGVTFKTFEGMPDVRDARGVVVLAGTTFGADIEHGEILAPTGEIIEVTAAAFAIAETATTVPVAHLEVQALGTTSAFGAIADQEPIRALAQFDIPPTALEGAGTARMSATWPMVDGMTMDEVQFRIVMGLTGLASAVPLEGRSIRNGDVELVVTPTVVTIIGTAVMDGVPANVDFAFPLTAEVDGRQQIRMVLDEEARRQLGFNLEGFLGGTVTASVTDLAPLEVGQHYELDLGPARLMLAPLGFTKPAGVPATMSFDIVQTPDGYHIRDVELVGDGFGLSGEAYLDRDYAIVSATINDFRLRSADVMSLTLEQQGNGFAIHVAGSVFDARGLVSEGIGNLSAPSPGGEMPSDLVVTGRFDRLIGFNGEVIRDATLAFTTVGGETRRVELSGILNDLPFSAVYQKPAGAAALDAYVGDAGAFLRFMNFYTKIQGGTLRLTALEYNDGSLRGQLAMTDFVVVDEPGLARLIAQPQTGPQGVAPIVPFEVLSFDFSWIGSRVTIEDALLRGGDMGAIGAGWLDLSAGALNITGTYIPAYSVNNLFGRIPLLGLALAGGQNEGLFGLTFRISGPFDEARMEVNPLSVIAPGIFRKIFQFQ